MSVSDGKLFPTRLDNLPRGLQGPVYGRPEDGPPVDDERSQNSILFNSVDCGRIIITLNGRPVTFLPEYCEGEMT